MATETSLPITRTPHSFICTVQITLPIFADQSAYEGVVNQIRGACSERRKEWFDLNPGDKEQHYIWHHTIRNMNTAVEAYDGELTGQLVIGELIGLPVESTHHD